MNDDQQPVAPQQPAPAQFNSQPFGAPSSAAPTTNIQPQPSVQTMQPQSAQPATYPPQPQQFQAPTPVAATPQSKNAQWIALGLAIASIIGFIIAWLVGYVVVLFGILGIAAISMAVRINPRPLAPIIIGAIGALLSLGGYLLSSVLGG